MRWLLLATGLVLVVTSRGDAQAEKARVRLNEFGHSGHVARVLFTKKNQLITVGHDRTVRVWDARTGERLRVLRTPMGAGHLGELYAAALSPDEESLAVAGFTYPQPGDPHAHVLLISLTDETIVHRFTDGRQNIHALSFSPDGRLLAAGGDERVVRIWDVATRKQVAKLIGHPKSIRGLAFQPGNPNVLAAMCEDQLRLWRLPGGDSVTVRKKHTSPYQRIAWSPDGTHLGVISFRGGIELFSPEGVAFKTLHPDRALYEYGGLAFSADGTRVAHAGRDTWRERVVECRIKDAKETREFSDVNRAHDRFAVGDVAYSPDGKYFAAADDENHAVFVWTTGNRQPPRRLAGGNRQLYAIGWAWDPNLRADPTLLLRTVRPENRDELRLSGKVPPNFFDRSFSLTSLQPASSISDAPGWGTHQIGKTRLRIKDDRLEVVTGKQAAVPLGLPGKLTVTHYTLVGDQRAVVSGDRLGLHVFDLARPKEPRQRLKLASPAVQLAPSPPLADGKRLLAVLSEDHVVRVYEPDTPNPLLLFTLSGPHWAAWTPQGYYAATTVGERWLGVQVAAEKDRMATLFPMAQFRTSLERPDVVGQAVTSGGQKPGQLARLEEVLPPRVRLLESGGAAKVEDRLEVRAEVEASAQNPVTALRLLVDGRPYQGSGGVKSFDPPRQGKFEESWSVTLPPGSYQVAVHAEAVQSKTVLTARGVQRLGTAAAGKQPPQLHVLAVGISAYPGPLRLNYADNDADGLADVFRKTGGGLFAHQSVTPLKNVDATAGRILKELDALRERMTDRDVAVISFAGHGDRDVKGRFYLLPADVNPNDPLAKGIPGGAFKDALAKIPGRVVVLLDACHSGALRPGSDSFVRALTAEDCGVVVMCSSAGSEVSLESPALKHGFFTAAVMDGLRGGADYNRDGVVNLKELDLYVTGQVQKMTNRRQHPVTEVPLTVRTINLSEPGQAAPPPKLGKKK